MKTKLNLSCQKFLQKVMSIFAVFCYRIIGYGFDSWSICLNHRFGLKAGDKLQINISRNRFNKDKKPIIVTILEIHNKTLRLNSPVYIKSGFAYVRKYNIKSPVAKKVSKVKYTKYTKSEMWIMGIVNSLRSKSQLPYNMVVDVSKPQMLTLRFTHYPYMNFNTAVINPRIILKIIKANFTIFERLTYGEDNLIKICISYITLFLDNISSWNIATRDMFELLQSLVSHKGIAGIPIIIQDDTLNNMLEYIKSLVTVFREPVDTDREDVLTFKYISKNSLKNILTVYSKVLYNDMQNAIRSLIHTAPADKLDW